MVANGLLSMRLPVEERIAMLDRNSDVACENLIGANKANVPLVPLNTRLAFADIVAVMADSEASIFFASSDLLPEVDLLFVELPKLDRVIVLEEDYAEWRDAQAVADPTLPTSLDHPFVQIYTSGTTGRTQGRPAQ